MTFICLGGPRCYFLRHRCTILDFRLIGLNYSHMGLEFLHMPQIGPFCRTVQFLWKLIILIERKINIKNCGSVRWKLDPKKPHKILLNLFLSRLLLKKEKLYILQICLKLPEIRYQFTA